MERKAMSKCFGIIVCKDFDTVNFQCSKKQDHCDAWWSWRNETKYLNRPDEAFCKASIEFRKKFE